MSARRPTFIVRNNGHSAYFFRVTIPNDLRKYINGINNIREFRISLKTGIKSEAIRFAQALKIKVDFIFANIRSGNNSATCVSSIKTYLRNYLDEQLLFADKGFDGIIEPKGHMIIYDSKASTPEGGDTTTKTYLGVGLYGIF